MRILDDYSKDYRFDYEGMATFLKGKSVCIVANGPKGVDGKFIDSHDVVVRMNIPHKDCRKPTVGWNPPPFIPLQYQEELGKRTDIFYHSFNFHKKHLGIVQRAWEAFRDEGGKYWCITPPNFSPHIHENLDLYKLIDEHCTVVRKPDTDFVWYIDRKYNARMLSGGFIILDILAFDIKSLYVTGYAKWIHKTPDGGIDTKIVLEELRVIRELWLEHRFGVDPICEKDFLADAKTGKVKQTPVERKDMKKETEAVNKFVAKDNTVRGKIDEVVKVAKSRISEKVTPILHSTAELHAMYEVVAGLHDPHPVLDGYVVNCGIYMAGSACVMAMALRDTKKFKSPLIAIDNWNLGSVYPNITVDECYVNHRKNIQDLQLEKHIVSVYHDNIAYLKDMWQNPIRVAFVDTSHHYDVAKQEIDIIRPHMVPGGWMIFHDYNNGHDGIDKAVHELAGVSDCQLFTIDCLALINFTMNKKSKKSAFPKYSLK